MIPNIHKVERNTWKQWSSYSRALFNEMMEVDHIITYRLPKSRITIQQAKVIKWNAAWSAAVSNEIISSQL